MIRRFGASLLFVGLLGASAPAAITTFGAPARNRVAGPLGSSPYNVILPSGRLITPAGKSVAVGMNALGLAITPDGKYLIVSNDDERQTTAANMLDRRVSGGFSLAVVNTRTMRVVDVRRAEAGEAFFVGIAALRDPANLKRTIVVASDGPNDSVRFFDLNGGHLEPDAAPIAMPTATDSGFADENHAFPAGLTISRDGLRAYVVNNLADSVSTIDVRTRSLLGTTAVGFFPYGVAAGAEHRLLVTDEGLMRYGVLSHAATVPAFADPLPDALHASALSIVSLSADGGVTAATPAQTLGLETPSAAQGAVGGIHPSAIATTRDGRYAYVALSNVDRVAIVSLLGAPQVIGAVQLALFEGAPYGTQPNAVAISRSGRLLYVALAGINAVAVLDARDPAHPRRIGLIPTGWYPTAVALSPDGRFLYIANAKGYGQDRAWQPGADSNAIWATVQRVDLRNLSLARATMTSLHGLRIAMQARNEGLVPPLRSLQPSSAIKHVVFILEENKTYDALLGDLKGSGGRPYGAGDPSLVSFGEAVTPNLHALALEFGLAINEYADAEESDAGHQFAAAGIASDYTEKTLLVRNARRPVTNKNEDPEDYPRGGYIFNSLQRANISYRDYGDLIRLSGYDEGSDARPRQDDPNFAGPADTRASTKGLGGLYTLDVPALLALKGHLDLDYPGWNLRIRDVRRAQEFIRDFGALAKANAVPQFTYVWLPDDHGGRGADIPPLPEEVADGDRALGMIVDFLSHSPTWSSTAIFITPDDAQSTRDHISQHRSYAIVISPYAKRHYVGREHLSTVSILKTEEELLGLPPLSLNDLLTSDMSAFFTPTPDVRPFTKIDVPTQAASIEGERIADLLLQTDQRGPDADTERSATLIGLSRAADALARARPTMTVRKYEARQRVLYDRALAVVGK